MLKVFRDNLKYLSWILWIVIAVFVLFVFVDFGRAGRGMGGGREAAATVGDQSVSFDEYRREYQSLEDQFRQIYGEQFTREVADQLQLPQRALDRAVNRKVLLAEAERLGLEVSDDEVQQQILSFPAFQDAQGQFVGAQEYEVTLGRLGYSVDQFEREMRDGLLIDRLNGLLASSIYITDDQVDAAYRKQVERAAIRFIHLPAASLATEATASREELNAYLEAHRDTFRLPEQRKVVYLLAEVAHLRDQVEVPDADVKSYYDGHPDEFTQEEQVQAQHILLRVNEERTAEQAEQQLAAARARIAGGESFAAVAAEISEDPGTASRGGSLGYFGRGRMTPEFENAAFDAPLNQVIGPVKTPFGVHLLEVTDHRQAGLQPFDEVAPRIRARLTSERVLAAAQERVQAVYDRLTKDEQTVTVDQLREVAAADDALSLQEPGPFGRDDMIPGVGRAADFTQAAFELAPGRLSKPVRVPRGYAVLLVVETLAPRDPSLAEVEPAVRQAVEQEKRQQLAMDRLAAARADIAEGGKTLDDVAGQLGLTVEESGEFGTGGAIQGLGFQPRIAEAAMSMQEGELGGPYGTSEGAVLFAVTSRTSVDAEQLAANRDQTRQQLAQQELGRLLSALIEQRKLELGVSYDLRLTQELGLTPREA
jgi:peptidyl-prolyl cis-trans isomerase D